MFRKLAFLTLFKPRNYSKFTFPTKESVCQSKPGHDEGSITSDKVVCPWKKTQPSVPIPENNDLKFHSKWRSFTLYLCLPVIILMSGSILLFKHDESTRPEFVPYPYLRIRKTKFPWGDGNKSLFHNPHRNALPDGYED